MSVDNCQRIGEQIVDHAALVGHAQAGRLDRDLQFVGRHELVPVDACRAAASAAHIPRRRWRARSSSCVRLNVAATIRPPGFTISRAASHEQRHIGDVLDHFHRQHDVEALARIGQVFRRRSRDNRSRARSAAACAARDLDILLRRIGADHRGAEPRQRLATGCRRRSRYRACAGPSRQPRLFRVAAEMRRPPGRGYRPAAPD